MSFNHPQQNFIMMIKFYRLHQYDTISSR